MATFPPLRPAIRTYTPGAYPHTTQLSLSGRLSIVRHSSIMLSGSLDLTYERLTEHDRKLIEDHYYGQLGEYESFTLSADVWSGFIPIDVDPYGWWRYAEPPEIEDFCGPSHNVKVRLISTPFGIPGAGYNSIVTSVVAGGATATTATGMAATVAVVFLPGAATINTANGMAATVTVTLLPGAGTSSDASAAGMATTITSTLTAGAASGNSTAQIVVIHFDGTFDNQAQGNTLTTEIYGSPQIATDFKKWGSGSGQFSFSSSYTGHSVAYDDPLLAPGTSDFTIESWVYMPADAPIKGETIIQIPTTYIGTGRLRISGTGEQLIWTCGDGELTHQTTITPDAWHHVWLVRESGTIKLALDGVQSSSNLSDTANYSYAFGYLGRKLVVGNYSTQTSFAFGGRIVVLRYTIGLARALSVPTGPYPNT